MGEDLVNLQIVSGRFFRLFRNQFLYPDNLTTLHFSEITITGYKNYEAQTFRFNERIIGICGLNGKGKTNLLDAIIYLCFTRSYFSRTEAMNVNFGAPGFRIQGSLVSQPGDQCEKIHCIYRTTSRKEFFLNDVPYEKFSQHIGRIPFVMIAPDDIGMITGGSEERRKFLDTLISQVDPEYLRQLILYNKVLLQRNSFLKNSASEQTFDVSLLEILDSQMIPPAEYIYATRKRFCGILFPLIRDFYKKISGSGEIVGTQYETQLDDKPLPALLAEYRQRDRLSQRTNAGIHKDDILFLLDKMNFKTIASQGQRKSLLFACKLSEFDILKQEKRNPPILLLDDVFEKLDENRISNLLQYVCSQNNGQVFITDTDAIRLQKALQLFDETVQIIEL